MDDGLVCRVEWFECAVGGVSRVTNTKRRIDTVISPDDGHIVARNM